MPVIQKDNFSTKNQVRSTLKTKRLRVPVHIHQFAELVYIIDGETTVRHHGTRELAKAGDVVILLPYQEHGFYTEDNKKIKYWMTLFSEDFMSDIIYHENTSFEYKNMVFKPSPELKALIEAKMFDTFDQIIEPSFEMSLDLKSLIYSTFSEFLRKGSQELREVSASQDQILSSDPVTKTINYLRVNFRNDISIDDCAKEIGYSASHISHCLQKNFHMTFLQLRNNIRISYAKHLLRFKRMSIYMVALECGFNCELTFKRVFKQLNGLTPQQFRKKHMISSSK